MGDGGGGHWLVCMEWHPSGWSVCLPPLIFPCTIKSRKFSSGTVSPGWSRKKGHKTVVVYRSTYVSWQTWESTPEVVWEGRMEEGGRERKGGKERGREGGRERGSGVREGRRKTQADTGLRSYQAAF